MSEQVTLTLPQALAEILRYVRYADTVLGPDYETRNICVLLALGAARNAGYEAGVRIDPKEPEWPVAFIELPQGQVSWHLPQHVRAWDGHTTAEKDERVNAFIIEQRGE